MSKIFTGISRQYGLAEIIGSPGTIPVFLFNAVSIPAGLLYPDLYLRKTPLRYEILISASRRM
jgi:hypothetical protein